MADAITATGLVKRYKTVTALDGVDLAVPTGSVLGLLGPNGAGKTTIVRILTTLLQPDEGSATVAGVDVLAKPRDVRRRIGLSGQYAAVDEYLTGFENLDMIGRLYHLGVKRSRERARELLASFRLEDAADRPSKTYSGGMRRRLDLAGALVADPPIIFLDEPTTGLDPRGRTEMWEVIQNLVAGGTTLLLTTQYLEEADLLADDIVVIDHGKIIAQGTADQLKTPGRRRAPRAHRPGPRDAARRPGPPRAARGRQGRPGRGPPHPAHADHRRRAGAHRGAAGPRRRADRHRRRRAAPAHARRRVPVPDRARERGGRPHHRTLPRRHRPHPGRHAATDESSTGGA